MFELGNVRFRPLEKEDLKLLHEWENDSETMLYSRSNPLSLLSLAQLENQNQEWIKD